MLQQFVLFLWIVGTYHVTEAQYHYRPVVDPSIFVLGSVSVKFACVVTAKLNTTVIPLNYIIRMRPILQNDIAPSEVTITVESVTNGSCNTIVLNQKDLTIYHDRVTVTNLQTGRNMSIVVPGVSTEIKNESCLNIFFSNKTMAIPAPPMSHDPSLKFKIIIGRLDGQYRSLSNMEIAKTEPDMDHEGWRVHCNSFFLMFSKRHGFPKQDIENGRTSFGTHTVAKSLQYYEKKFKMNFPLSKLDAAVVPLFPTKTSATFGLVTYRYCP
ncbi:Endoplasmic reticulum aminopeptidase 2 [Orchesella cincta]|uniref:Endoplasmic reticulum aminopeptidase 2 n=1 Tax=Orchesella cincta TaxID=48709 RepID=A0A1D2MA72_ORCCI|nr:Endoplasmic reticulum aminopeptidase 2 [Orchesella cincta]